MMFDWISVESLRKHIDKHIINSKEEKKIWINNFQTIKDYLYNKNYLDLEKEYRNISIENTQTYKSHYLYKDTYSQDISLNYYTEYDNNYLTTCIKNKINYFKIVSCFFKKYCGTNLLIFLSINNLKYEDIKNQKMVISNFKCFTADLNDLDIIYKKAIINANLNDPTKTEDEILLKFKICIIIECLSYLKNKQIKLFKERETNYQYIYLYEVLYKIFYYKYNYLYGKNNKSIVFTAEERVEMLNLYNTVCTLMSDNDLYLGDKIYIDLLGEFINLYNKYSKNNFFIKIENSNWKDFFERI